MSKKLIILVAASLLSAYATGAKLNLTQDLGGLDLGVAMEPPDDPVAIRISNKSAKEVACVLGYAGADAGTPVTVTVQPGTSDTVQVEAVASNAVRNGRLKCRPKPVPSK